MKRVLNFLIILSIILILPSCNENEYIGKGFGQESLNEVNFIRSNPSGYAEARLKGPYNDGVDNGAYNDIKNRGSVPTVELEDKLISAAKKYAQFLAENNVMGHYENGEPPDRCEAEGYIYFSGENLATCLHNSEPMDPPAPVISTVFPVI